ncbi:RNA polymerase sigma factor SigB [Mycobacteroides abscessus subsp. abscessus]|uniref:sigma-70 family RNA polymerase sigma factor n=1 Tax=Mycobacteroides abscessus TaxID=36809 RepID=UPI0009294359|nr:sigma-70 family RNA polymerase sigma factor [Mycobacteroides abscessus]SIJ20760.1 RNA polymerase sigma factor SigB [Mycobacteroides abscessus subsp. abscessus]SLH39535.1 RNA polymerase sigma factor SigB [Mycobacteroides abscessus subsp. abscessus]
MDRIEELEIAKDLPGLLTAEQEVELAKRIEAGLYAEHLLAKGVSHYTPAQLRAVAADGRVAFEQFVTANIRLAAWWARKRAAVGAKASLTVEDLTDEGVLGIIRAVQKFDYTQGFKFSTYATMWVRNHIQRAIAKATPATLSAGERERCEDLLAVSFRLSVTLGRPATDAELAAAMGTSVAVVGQLQNMLRRAVSLDTPVGDGGRDDTSSLLDYLAAQGSGDMADDRYAATQRLSGLLQRLTARERFVIAEVFGLRTGVPESVAAIADKHRVPVIKVRTLVESAMAKLRGSEQVAA